MEKKRSIENDAKVNPTLDSELWIIEGDRTDIDATTNDCDIHNFGNDMKANITGNNVHLQNGGDMPHIITGSNSSGILLKNTGENGRYEVESSYTTVVEEGSHSVINTSGNYNNVVVKSIAENANINNYGSDCKFYIRGNNPRVRNTGDNVSAKIQGDGFVIEHRASDGEYVLDTYGRMFLYGHNNKVICTNDSQTCDLEAHGDDNDFCIYGNDVGILTFGDNTKIGIQAEDIILESKGRNIVIHEYGYNNRMTLSGENITIYSIGVDSKIDVDAWYSVAYLNCGKIRFGHTGSYLVTTEWKSLGPHLPDMPIVHTIRVDGIQLKHGIWYNVRNGILLQDDEVSQNNNCD